MKIAVGTGFYEVKSYVNYQHSMEQTVAFFAAANIAWEPIKRVGDSYVTLAKNGMLAKFLHHTDCTHILMIDSDLGWDLDGLARILKADVDMVGGTYPKKNKWEEYCCQIFLDKDRYPKVDEKTGLIESAWLPGGFLKLSRRCVERMTKAYEIYSYHDKAWDVPAVELFATQISQNQFVTEDVVFSHRWQALGEKCWLEPNISFSHSGCKDWVGNFDTYLQQDHTKDVLPDGLESPLPETESLPLAANG